jgi:NADPH:quinone reductase-like Zn-dependent oxidoreductase
MGKRGRIHGSTLRARPLEQKADGARRVEAEVLPLVSSGAVRVPVAATFPLEEAAAAYARFAEGGKLGKVVLLVSP